MKKLISLLLVAMMVLSLGLVSASADDREVIIATNSLGNGWPATFEEDWVYQKILADTGISMKLVLVDDYYTAMGTRLYDDDAPDMFVGDAEHLRTWAREELLLDLTPYMDKELAPFFAWLGETSLTSYYLDGKIYSLPKIYDGSKHQYGVTFRQDWLDALKLQVPTTIQELFDVATAFTQNDPDGNGLNDTYGLTANKGNYVFDTILGSYDTCIGNYIIIRDGKVTNTLLQPGMLAGLEWCKKFVDAKIIDPDCVTRSGQDFFKAGQAGLLTISWPGVWKAYGQQQIHDVNPNAVCGHFTTFKSEVGAPEVMLTVDYNTAGTSYAINADVSDEKLATIFDLINYIISEEGSNLVFYGLENVHWVKEDGQIKMTDRATEANYISTYQLFSRKEAEYLAVKFPEATHIFEDTMSAGRIEVYNSLVIESEDMYLADMEAYIKGEQLKFIYGERPLTAEEYQKFIGELNDVYGFDAYMEDAAEQLAAHGII